MPKSRNRKKPQKKRSRMPRPPSSRRSPKKESVRKFVSEQVIPHLRAQGFNNVLIIGYRRVPENEREQEKGAEEVPFVMHDFQSLFSLTSLVNWALEDGQKRLVQAALQPPAQPQESPPKKEEP